MVQHVNIYCPSHAVIPLTAVSSRQVPDIDVCSFSAQRCMSENPLKQCHTLTKVYELCMCSRTSDIGHFSIHAPKKSRIQSLHAVQNIACEDRTTFPQWTKWLSLIRLLFGDSIVHVHVCAVLT